MNDLVLPNWLRSTVSKERRISLDTQAPARVAIPG